MNSHTSNRPFRGTADSKKSDIDALTNKITNTQYEVDQLQSLVDALSTKAGKFAAFLSAADANKNTALTNLNLVTDAVNKVKNLSDNANLAMLQTKKAAVQIVSTSDHVSLLINKLILSVEVIDQLTKFVNKQKTLNPLIPDELITLLTKATTDANNAVATTLTALTSCYAAEATVLEADKITILEAKQAKALYEKMTVMAKPKEDEPGLLSFIMSLGDDATGILALLQNAYNQSVTIYEQELIANSAVTAQLEFAQSQLSKATTKLNSLKAGLAASQAAAFAA